MIRVRFELTTYGLEDRCSIQLSYWYKSLLSIREARQAVNGFYEEDHPIRKLDGYS